MQSYYLIGGNKCREILNKLLTVCVTSGVWASGHRDIPGNSVAHELAKNGTVLTTVNSAQDVGTRLSSAKYLLSKVSAKQSKK